MQVDQRVSTEVSGEVSMSDAAEKKTGYSGDQPSVSPAPINGDVEEGSNNDLSASELTLTSQTVLSDLTLEGGQEVEESANWEGGGNNQNGDVGEGEEVQEEVEEGVEWQDILGNGQLMKKVMRKGEGLSTRPTSQCRVKVRTRGFLESGVVVEKHSGYWFTVGDGDVVQAWDIAVTLMECGEVARIKAAPRFAYGSNGKGSIIPGDATITYELELLQVLEPVKFSSLNEDELVKIVERKKTRGNELYQDKEYSGAIKSYQKGLQAIQRYLEEKSMATDVPSNLVEMQIRCLNNIAAAQLKVKQYREALSACEDVLQKDPDNVKALYRAGRVLAHMGELEEAVHKLQRALSKSPEDKTIQTELKRTFKKKEQTLKQEKAMYKRMMEPEPPSKPQSSPQRDTTWGPWPYMFIAGTTAVVAMGIAYFITQRH